MRSFKRASDFRLFRGHTRLRTPSKRLLRPELKDSQESQTKEGLGRNRSCRHISSHKHQLRFIRGRKGHLKQHQRRLRVTRSLLSILHIPVCYLSCYVDRQPYILWNTHYSTNHCLLLETSPFPQLCPTKRLLESATNYIMMIINAECPECTLARIPNHLSGFL